MPFRRLSLHTTHWVAYKYKNLLFTILEAGSPRAGCQHGWVRIADFSMHPHLAEGALELCGISLFRALNSFIRVPPSWRNYFPKAALPNAGFQHVNLGGWAGGDTNIQSTATCFHYAFYIHMCICVCVCVWQVFLFIQNLKDQQTPMNCVHSNWFSPWQCCGTQRSRRVSWIIGETWILPEFESWKRPGARLTAMYWVRRSD